MNINTKMLTQMLLLGVESGVFLVILGLAVAQMPPWLYGFIFWPERIIMNPKLNDFLRRTLQSQKGGWK